MPRSYTLAMVGAAIARATAACALVAATSCGGGSKDRPDADAKAPPPAPDKSGDPRETPATDPRRADEIEDLERLCAALNRDYGDGTLGDYFADLQMKTKWGAQVMAEGNQADRPGRFLQSKIESLSPGAADPKLDACRELLDYIDEVE